MLDSNSILQLFGNVLKDDIERYGISQQDIRRAVYNMAHVYAPQIESLKLMSAKFANYNDVAHRCAYLHKYAAFHTAMVQDMMFRILKKRRNLFKTITSSREFRICSLGGGPGNDVIGVIAALNTIFSTFKVHVTVVDLMEQWKFTFSSVIAELAKGNYGALRTNVADNFLKWNYIAANLLEKMTNPVKLAISEASLIILVKFVSAAACQKTEKMIKRIFREMKPGALLLFIDNAGGGFRQLIRKAANEYKCDTVFGPLNYNEYCNEALKSERFGYTSCFTTTVTVHLLQKSMKQQGRTFYDDISDSSDSENDTISSAATCIAKTVKEKKDNPHSVSTLSHNRYGLHQNAYLPVNVNRDAIVVPSYQQNANISSDLRTTAKLTSAKKILSTSTVSTSQNNPSLIQSAKMPASVNKNYAPVSSDQKNISISSSVALSQKSVSKKNIKPQTPQPSINIPSFNSPVNSRVYATAPSTSQTVNNFNKSVNSPQNSSVKSNNLPVKHPQAIPTSGHPLSHDSTSVTEPNGYTSSRMPNNTRGAYTAVPTNINRTNSAVPPQSQSNVFLEPEDNSDTCCSCCVIS